jgi:TetR/AcrR family transcriptional repressor of lmrAB and yxaGH operons
MASTETHDRLLDATEQLLARHGYQGTGVNAVLAVSGVRNGSLYHHFPAGKDELVAASITRTGEQTAELIALAMTRGPEAATRAIFDHLAARLEDDEFEAGCRIATPLADAAGDVDQVRAAAAGAFARWTDTIAEGLVAHGWSRKPARATAEAVICLFEGAILLGLAQQSRHPLVVARDAALVLIAAGAPAV